MSSKPEPAIWSLDTGQRIACFDSYQLTITWIPKIKDIVVMVIVLLSYFSRYWRVDGRMYVWTVTRQANFLDQWITKFFKVWAPLMYLWCTGALLKKINSLLPPCPPIPYFFNPPPFRISSFYFNPLEFLV